MSHSMHHTDLSFLRGHVVQFLYWFPFFPLPLPSARVGSFPGSVWALCLPFFWVITVNTENTGHGSHICKLYPQTGLNPELVSPAVNLLSSQSFLLGLTNMAILDTLPQLTCFSQIFLTKVKTTAPTQVLKTET